MLTRIVAHFLGGGRQPKVYGSNQKTGARNPK
jgi:hypothetical protein